MSGLVTLGASDSRSSCIQNNVVVGYGLANASSDLIPRNVNYNVGIGGSIVSPVTASSDGTCTAESTVAGAAPERPMTTVFGYSTINKSDNEDCL